MDIIALRCDFYLQISGMPKYGAARYSTANYQEAYKCDNRGFFVKTAP
jgi:hypothetical protein